MDRAVARNRPGGMSGIADTGSYTCPYQYRGTESHAFTASHIYPFAHAPTHHPHRLGR